MKMTKIKNIIRLMRVKHYIKNGLVFAPLIFSGDFLQPEPLLRVLIAFAAFSAMASAVYIFNDIHDVENDRRHPVKRERPIASGAVSVREGYALAAGLIAIALALDLGVFGTDLSCLLFLLAYLLVNLAYSLGGKHIPFLDIALLVSGFLLRVLYGAAAIDVQVSDWLCLTVIALSIYMGLGKRRNELLKCGEDSGRKVLQYYSTAFCDQFMNVCMTCALIFYALWSADEDTTSRIGNNLMVWTVPLVFFILMKYCAVVEGNSYGDPVEVLLHDKVLLALCVVFGVMMLGIIYLPLS